MNFCPKCQFMVYTKLNSDKKGLINYCKNCSWEGDYIHDQDNICVYTKNYSKDYIIQNGPMAAQRPSQRLPESRKEGTGVVQIRKPCCASSHSMMLATPRGFQGVPRTSKTALREPQSA